MVTKIKYYILAIIVLVLLRSTSCDLEPCYRGYQFVEPISIYPAKDTICVGDTFYIDINTNTNMYDINEKVNIELKDEGIYTGFTVFQLTEEDRDLLYSSVNYMNGISLYPEDKSFTDNFTITTFKGTSENLGDHGNKVLYDIEDGNFIHKSMVIAKDTGTFLFSFYDANYYFNYGAGGSLHPDLTNTECVQSWMPGYFRVNEGVSNSYITDYYNVHSVVNSSTASETRIHNLKHGSWQFVVVPK